MRQRALGIAVAVIVGAVLVSASGAATTKAQKVTKINVSTRAAVVHYLRSIHVNPKGAVIQRGLRNYAGARCPGGRWTCASTKHTVVQIAKRGGQNRFVCKSSKCAVVQLSGVSHGVYFFGRRLASTAPKGGGGNSGTCIKTTGLVQSCVISQLNPGGNTGNIAKVVEGQVNGAKSSGLTQTASYTASITQTNGSGDNTACVLQSTNMDGSTVAKKGTPVTVTLQAHQWILINQDSISGNNFASNAAKPDGSDCDSGPLLQSQTLTSTATGSGPIKQNEDAAYSPCGDSVPGGTDYANLCLDIEQNQGIANGSATSGTNDATFTQTSTQTAIASTSAGSVNQTQSTPLCSTQAAPTSAPADCVFPGGLVGTVNQDSSVKSTATATQVETQCEDASTVALTGCSPTSDNIPAGWTQKQYGPVGVGNVRHNHRGRSRVGFSHGKGLGQSIQTGGTGNNFKITQTSTQNADAGATQQNFGQADCTTSGNCIGTQDTTNNGGTTNNGNGGTGTVTFGTSCTSNCTTTGNFPSGNVLVSVGNGKVQAWNPNASGGPALVRTLDTGTASFTTGLAFDSSKNLYVTDFNANDVTKFNNDGSLAGPFGTGYGANPESIVFDSSGNAYVGQAGDSPGVQNGSQNVLKFSSAGSNTGTFTPAIQNRGTDWIDLASDGCTLYYTSEGTSVKTFNVCTNTQGTDFATGLPGPGEAFAIKLLPGGGALVADDDSIVRLDGSGNVVQHYGTGESTIGGWFSLALDPSGSSFWAGDLFTGAVKKFDLATGNVLASFNTGSTVVDGEAAGLAISP